MHPSGLRPALALILSALTIVTLVAGARLRAAEARGETVIFHDDFDTPASYHPTLTPNATTQEYKTNSLPEGHLLKKWIHSWPYDPLGDWQQAFYVVAPGETAMTQAGRSACRMGQYRLAADAEIPAAAARYRVTLRQFKNDNDALCFIIGGDRKGSGGVTFGYENQLPGTDETVADAYLRGAFGTGVIKRGVAAFRRWADVAIEVNVRKKTIAWSMNGQRIADGAIATLKPGGFFGIYMCFERGTKFDDVKIVILDTP
jgi:hypothetical protein